MTVATCGACRCKTGRASAQDAQYAGDAKRAALMRPKPPIARGRCARAKAWTGNSLAWRSWERHWLIARSWLAANAIVCAGGSSRSR